LVKEKAGPGGVTMQWTLHLDHLKDMERSGLTPDTIRRAGVYTVPPDEIGLKKNQRGLPEGVVSALAFPYPGFDGYQRFKVWWEEGRTGPKYLARAGTPNHFYFPPSVDLKGTPISCWWRARRKPWP
jgi:hypothetical protein